MIDFVFIGDSILDWFNVNYYFPNNTIKNYGIAGDTISGVLYRISDTKKAQARNILVLVGHNDLCMGYSIETSLKEYSILCDKIQLLNFEKVFISGLLPIDFINVKTVIDFNKGLNNLAIRNSYNYIEIREHFLLPNGRANPAFSDGLHLTEKGYGELAKIYSKFVY